MNKADLLKKITTPIDSPAFPAAKVKFHNRDFMNITYRTDHDALMKVLPEPLEPIDDLVKFEFINMPDSDGLGDYAEIGQVIPVTFNGQEGEFYLSMYVNNAEAIASGREIAAFPKKLADTSIYLDNDVLVGKLEYSGLPVATATMAYNYYPMDLEEAKAEITKPSYRLNIMRNYDATPRVLEMTESTITDVEVKGAWNSPAKLQLFEHVMAPVADLPVREIVKSQHIVADLTLPRPHMVYDYLAD
ncbi:acetoacetate decarboxylase [Weissella viridescens]|jgi:acetoacetate decarboxylase|uniref:acetoacetate decarboxylase n=1 Tax=Weissella viridescens TaxID=1629 RepID=UPI00092EDE42|nr:acetoacetate decarboxylase [Weissella viridescens]MBX4173422.1 acetoacetate decarboxylase [Weissella viridescens]MCB6840687.1 acetoacetate decarboxylase [Weissella viridescens]MCB6847420.1 acetoacetate decarboxylase [Weissella viridescens]QOD85858.1 acetoacetate decarboxylase [Weissella viridescens]